MKRFLLKKLLEWKEDSYRKPLLLLGARQVGKTWLIKEFGRKYFKYTAYIRFDQNKAMHAVFDQDYNLKRILLALQIESGLPIDPENTLIVFDEIQTCPSALTSLKYFCEEAREYHVIGAGSLLGVADQYNTGFPVGKVNRLYLYPMSFGEFLVAGGNEMLFQLIQNRDWQMIRSFETKYIELLRYYYFTGGMPEVVETFLQTQDFKRTRMLQNTLLADFKDDFGRHAPGDLRFRIEKIWDSIPVQLARENKKFIYSQVEAGAGIRSLEPALQWLMDSGLVTAVNRVSKPGMPLESYADGAFKLFFLDVGLLAAKANLGAEVILEGNRIFQEFKGALTEQYVLQELLSQTGLHPYYWASGKGQAEVDFLIEKTDGIIPIEAKAERNLQAKSLKFFCGKFCPAQAVRTSMSHYFTQMISAEGFSGEQSRAYRLTDLPLYGISALEEEVGSH